MYAKIIIDITHEKLDRTFEYEVPKDMEDGLAIGSSVLVPFGNRDRLRQGFVVGFAKECSFDPEKIKAIHGKAPKSVSIEENLVSLAAWMKEHYGGTMIQALKTVWPVKKEERPKEKRMIHRTVSVEEGRKWLAFFQRKNQKARARLLEVLLKSEDVDYGWITRKLGVTAQVVRALEEKKILTVERETVFRNPVRASGAGRARITYTEEQQEAIRIFQEDYERARFDTYLLYGVTGSGKTEVYMEMIRTVVSAGRQAIVLIPEIALTYQTVMRFVQVFGNRVSIMNSRLSAGERYDQMMRVRSGEIDVMIGPRSALFTPFEHLGLIVMDEEHEATYKSEQVPRYHARETAIERARIEGASVVLGSATPSLEAFAGCKKGTYRLLRLTKRAKEQQMAQVSVVDMRDELKNGNRSIISDALRGKIYDRLEKKEQIMLFLNRRGFAGFLSCRSCGYVVKCPHCDVSLSWHKGGRMVCHYCSYEEKVISVCPSCGSPHIGAFKAGTQQVEELIKKEFPQAGVLRMDLDTTREKESYEKILSAFADQEADILVGTQMIVKGHDFPNVTLVGVLAADLSLYMSDFRAAERTFALLCQAAGRAGRGSVPGEAVIQSYHPEHYSIQTAARQDYEAFFEQEMKFRSLMGYPPSAHLMAILMISEDEALLEKGAYYLKIFAKAVGSDPKLEIIGPASPAVAKIRDLYRKALYLKHEDYQVLIAVKNKIEQYIEINEGFSRIRIQFDFDPVQAF
ncbi:MAG: primosomal protein N' [Lachnospiraceae bacterium]|nr:primosomal protein N' [Lachnospiraceae bacterium]